MSIATESKATIVLIGDSIINGLCSYRKVWSEFFEPVDALNFGIKGRQNLSCIMENTEWRDTSERRVSGYTLWNKQPGQR